MGGASWVYWTRWEDDVEDIFNRLRQQVYREEFSAREEDDPLSHHAAARVEEISPGVEKAVLEALEIVGEEMLGGRQDWAGVVARLRAGSLADYSDVLGEIASSLERSGRHDLEVTIDRHLMNIAYPDAVYPAAKGRSPSGIVSSFNELPAFDVYMEPRIDLVLRQSGPDGTGSLLDIDRFSKAQTTPRSTLLELFGTLRPLHAKVEELADDLADTCEARGECRYLAAYDASGRPVSWFFFGASGD